MRVRFWIVGGILAISGAAFGAIRLAGCFEKAKAEAERPQVLVLRYGSFEGLTLTCEDLLIRPIRDEEIEEYQRDPDSFLPATSFLATFHDLTRNIAADEPLRRSDLRASNEVAYSLGRGMRAVAISVVSSEGFQKHDLVNLLFTTDVYDLANDDVTTITAVVANQVRIFSIKDSSNAPSMKEVVVELNPYRAELVRFAMGRGTFELGLSRIRIGRRNDRFVSEFFKDEECRILRLQDGAPITDQDLIGVCKYELKENASVFHFQRPPESKAPERLAMPIARISLQPSIHTSDLAAIPELLLRPIDPPAHKGESPRSDVLAMNSLFEQIVAFNQPDRDGYIRSLQATRTDLAGLPFLLGDACRLDGDGRDRLIENSLVAHRALAVPEGSDMSETRSLGDIRDAFYLLSKQPTHWEQRLSVFDQVFAVADANYRTALIRLIEKQRTPATAAFLARRAIFEIDDNVRAAAVQTLAPHRTAADEALLDAFRHPWLPASRHAAEALVTLKRTDLIDRLESLLDEPSPDSPVAANDGKGFETRELVRVNHHKNCFLCHPPASSEELRSGATGLVPLPGDSIPSFRSSQYYFGSEGRTFVRGDVTYLRQDFSVLLPVANAAPWPTQQRFDFLVRTHRLDSTAASERPSLTLAETDAGAALRFAIERLRDLKAAAEVAEAVQ